MRARAFTAAAAALVLLLTGCASGGDGPDDGTIRLRFQSLAWQQESVDANKELVAEWNAAHPDIQVDYVQGSWDSVHDQLLTSFEGGEAPTSRRTAGRRRPSGTGSTACRSSRSRA
jgi:ABC-type glycerol-3-phosphate transport system substrate-binding protein